MPQVDERDLDRAGSLPADEEVVDRPFELLARDLAGKPGGAGAGARAIGDAALRPDVLPPLPVAAPSSFEYRQYPHPADSGAEGAGSCAKGQGFR